MFWRAYFEDFEISSEREGAEARGDEREVCNPAETAVAPEHIDHNAVQDFHRNSNLSLRRKNDELDAAYTHLYGVRTL